MTPAPASPGAAQTIERLQSEIIRYRQMAETERMRSQGLMEELRLAKEQNVTVQKLVEQEEEFITNKLMKRLDQLKKEKATLATEVEQEEEFLTNTLQKKLDKLAREKVDLENRLEAEQEYIVNKLRKQLESLSLEKSKLHREKVDLENQLEAEQEYIMNKLQKQVDTLALEKVNLAREKLDLKKQVAELGAAVEKLARDKVDLEQQFEMEEENLVNRLQRQLEVMVNNYKQMERGLEMRGMSLRDLGILPSDVSQELTRTYSRSSSVSSSFEKQTSGSFGVSSSHSSMTSLQMHQGLSGGPHGPHVYSSFAGARRDRPTSCSNSGLPADGTAQQGNAHAALSAPLGATVSAGLTGLPPHSSPKAPIPPHAASAPLKL